MHIIGFWVFITFTNLCIGGENIAHLIQSNKPMYKYMEFYLLNWVKLIFLWFWQGGYGTTQRKVCCVETLKQFLTSTRHYKE
jgi:hypothetical protein